MRVGAADGDVDSSKPKYNPAIELSQNRGPLRVSNASFFIALLAQPFEWIHDPRTSVEVNEPGQTFVTTTNVIRWRSGSHLDLLLHFTGFRFGKTSQLCLAVL